MAAGGHYDVLVDAKWNRANCRMVELADGPGATWSGDVCRRLNRYRFIDGAYELFVTESENCSPLPEGTSSFRG